MESSNIIRKALESDILSILGIYNQGIEDRIATLEEEAKDYIYMKEWFERHQGRYRIVVAEQDGSVAGWPSLNPYSNRCAYDGVADLSVYISRDHRGRVWESSCLMKLNPLLQPTASIKLSSLPFPLIV